MPVPDALRWAAAGVLALASGYLIVGVPVMLYIEARAIARRNEDRGVSGAWLAGSVVGWVAVLAAPLGTSAQRLAWSWVPLAIEAAMAATLLLAMRISGTDRRLAEQRRARDKAGEPGDTTGGRG